MEQVRDNKSEQEFELMVDGHRAVAAYQREGGRIVFTHTLVPPAIEGRGVASRLIRAALDSARDQGLKVVPQCPFVATYMDRHPEYRDLRVQLIVTPADAGVSFRRRRADGRRSRVPPE